SPGTIQGDRIIDEGDGSDTEEHIVSELPIHQQFLAAKVRARLPGTTQEHSKNRSSGPDSSDRTRKGPGDPLCAMRRRSSQGTPVTRKQAALPACFCSNNWCHTRTRV